MMDRFHVQKLASEAVQEMRVKARWEALNEKSIPWHMPGYAKSLIMLQSSKMGIQESSCW